MHNWLKSWLIITILKRFMNIKMFNEWQIKWILKLTVFDFVIKHWLKKSNFMNALFQRFDYQDINGKMQNLLSILQQKLSKIELINICTPKMQSMCVIISYFFNFDQIEKNTSSNFLKPKKKKKFDITYISHHYYCIDSKQSLFEKKIF